jgi:hypothetical protein
LAVRRTDLLVRHDCTRTEPAIFAIYVPSSKQLFDSPCNLRTSHSVHRAIFAPPAAGRGAIVWDGSSPALILMVLPVWLGRSLDRNGSGTAALNYKVRSSQGRGIGFRFVPHQKEVIRALYAQHNRPRTVIRACVMRGLGNAAVAQNAPKICHFVPLFLAKLLLQLAWQSGSRHPISE